MTGVRIEGQEEGMNVISTTPPPLILSLISTMLSSHTISIQLGVHPLNDGKSVHQLGRHWWLAVVVKQPAIAGGGRGIS